MPSIISRHAEESIDIALSDTRVIVVVGARQSGKSTLVEEIIGSRRSSELKTLDDPTTLGLAHNDPVGFIESTGLLAIDEIQRDLGLILPIKARVDRDKRPGQFLLTGSAQVFALKAIPDSLAGRVETIELWPFSQSEIENSEGKFVSMCFDGNLRKLKTLNEARSGIWKRVIIGGFPEARKRTLARRTQFFQNYTHDTVERNISEISRTENPSEVTDILDLLSGWNGKILNIDKLSQASQIPSSTLRNYLRLLELSFLIKTIPAWSNSATARATKSKKLAFVDSGIACYLSGFSDGWDDTAEVGHVLESFVLMEISRLAQLAKPGIRLHHYRTRDGVEVDGILTRRGGDAIGIEVKGSLSVNSSDFRHLHHLREKLGRKFKAGIVFYTGNELGSFGNGMWAVPLSTMWAN